MFRFLASARFWVGFGVAFVVLATVFAWQTGRLGGVVPSPVRLPLTRDEIAFTAFLLIVLPLNAGLYSWHKTHGSCPVGVKKASGIAGIIGAITLLCPVCTVLPFTLLGATVTLAFLAPFLPLLRVIAIVLLLVSTWMLWPRGKTVGR